jgi:predicted nucleic acid-binding protein
VILVDSSAWIDFLQRRDTKARARLLKLIKDGADLVTTEPIVMELLAGGDTPARQAGLEQLTNGLPLLAVDSRLDYRAAAGLFVTARRSGRTIRSLVDCLIASVAIRNDVPLLHRDRDFDVIAEISPLRTHE